jgi:hypothetical protein
VVGEFLDGRLGERARGDGVNIARKHAGDVRGRFALAEAYFRR